MTAANIHLSRLAAEEPEADEIEDDAPALGRLRAVNNSPAREYAQRSGEVERLPDSVAALILCKVGRAKIERHQIKVSLDGEDLFFASPNSIMITALNGTGERVLWALNRRAPEVLHLLKENGSYVESLPRKGEAQWFSQDAASKAAMADAKAHLNRDMERLAELHAPDTAAAAADTAANSAMVARLVQTFPAASESREATGFERAEQLSGVLASVDVQKARRAAFKRGPVANAEDFAAPAARVPAEIEEDEDDGKEWPGSRAEAGTVVADASEFC